MIFPPRITIQRFIGAPGRKLWDKSPHKLVEQNPDQVYLFSAQIFLRREPVWSGDLNLSDPQDFFALKDFSASIRRNVIVSKASDVSVLPDNELLMLRSVVTFLPNGQQVWDQGYAGSYIFNEEGVPVYAPESLDEYFSVQRKKITAPVMPRVTSSTFSRKVPLFDLETHMKIEISSPDFGLATLVRDPYSMFYDHVAKEVGIDPMFLYPEQVVVSIPTARKLNSLMLEFIEDEYGSDKEGAFKAAKAIIKAMQPHVGLWLGIQDNVAYYYPEGKPR